jgi:hypothetical protein
MGVGWGVVQHGGVVKMFSGLVMRLRRPVVGFFGPLRRLPRPTLRDDKAALCELTGALRQFFSPCGCRVARRLLHEGSRERYGGVQPTGLAQKLIVGHHTITPVRIRRGGAIDGLSRTG